MMSFNGSDRYIFPSLALALFLAMTFVPGHSRSAGAARAQLTGKADRPGNRRIRSGATMDRWTGTSVRRRSDPRVGHD